MVYQQTFQRLLVPIAIIIGLFVVYYGVSYSFKNKLGNDDDLYVAGRTIGGFVNGSAMSASWESLATFMGVVALIVSLQLPFLALWATLLLSIPLIVLLYGQSLRRLESYTPATFCKERYGDKMGVLMALLIVVVMVMYALGQFIGLAKIANILFGWPFDISILAIATIVVGYVIIGGMYGVSYNAALQFWIMLTAAFVPMMLVLKELGAVGWWFPPLGYGTLVPEMQNTYPSFFDLKFSLKWYVAMFVAMGLGPAGMPHLAQRVFTSESVKTGRQSVLWFIAITGLLFATMYSVGFAGVYWIQTQGIDIATADFDKMIFFLNFAFNGDAITGYVVAGAIAGALSTVSAHMMAISAAVAKDIREVVAPDLDSTTESRLGYTTIIAAGALVAVVALNPPSFLVVSILWAFSLSAAAITPVIVLGVWSSRVNEYGAIAASLAGAGVIVLFSPHFFPNVTLSADGLTAEIGLDAAMIAVPISTITIVLVSLLAERVDGFAIDRESNQMLINRMHGYPEDGVQRFASAWPLLLLATLTLPLLWWGLLSWPA